jgi:hypothetical protein
VLLPGLLVPVDNLAVSRDSVHLASRGRCCVAELAPAEFAAAAAVGNWDTWLAIRAQD